MEKGSLIIIGLIIVAALSPLAYYGFTSYFRTTTIVGIVLKKNVTYKLDGTNHRKWGTMLLMVITDDTINGYAAKEMRTYYFSKDYYDAIDVGYLVKGTPSKKDSSILEISEVSPFLSYPITFAGYYVDYSASLSTFGYLGLELYNWGDESITAVRAELNGTFIPFTFGIT